MADLNDAKVNAQSIQNNLLSKVANRRFDATLTTESFVSIFNHVQQSQKAQNLDNEKFGINFRTKQVDIEISNELDKKQKKSEEAFQSRLEDKLDKQEVSSKDYNPEIFRDTFIGTMIAIMEAIQNDRKAPIFSSNYEQTKAESLGHISDIKPYNDFEQPLNNDQQPNLRLVIDGVPSGINGNSVTNKQQNIYSELSEQDVAVSYIFGSQLASNHQQLKNLSEGSLASENNDQSMLKAS